MKLIGLIFSILCCAFIGVSQQQLIHRRLPLPFFYPYYYYQPQVSRNFLHIPPGYPVLESSINDATVLIIETNIT